MFDFDKIIRLLARGWKYQTLFSASEKFKISRFDFENYNKLQMTFLHFIILYHNMYESLSMEDEMLSEQVIADDMRLDAYLYYRTYRKKQDKKNDEFRKKHEKTTNKVDMNRPDSWEFKFLKPGEKIKEEGDK